MDVQDQIKIIQRFIKTNPDFSLLEAYRMNFCSKCGDELDAETKSNLFDYLECVTGKNGEQIVPSVNACGFE